MADNTTTAPKQSARRRGRVQPQVAGPLPGGKPELTAQDLKSTDVDGAPGSQASGSGTQPAAAPQAEAAPAAAPVAAEPKPAEAAQPQSAEATRPASTEVEPTDAGQAVLRFEDPPEGASVSEKVKFYHDRIRPARERWEESRAKADSVFADEAGYPLWCVLQQRLHLELQNDQNNGECFKNAEEYLKVVWDITKATGYRLLARIPVLAALGYEIDSETRRNLSVRQVAVLAPVAKLKDPEEAAEKTRMVWRATVETGKATPERLKHFRDQILAGTKWDDLELFEASPKAPAVTAVQKLDKVLTKVNTTELIEVAKRDPARAREMADYLRPILTALDTAASIAPMQASVPAPLTAESHAAETQDSSY
ncbi:hypothetical protein [Streptomyces sp. NPDC058268]|uniref:hypothetical protein n=1 Tax=Streptomyces sp. NPDC058268 TaxID=3346413 RepID=UPI0036E42B65